ncbi:MAG: glycoside hydrolase family 3 C-terminal domain-containing protein [Gammaproteobacteria bacterium]|nr:glycoside hydrolase family 3 C-terminal domain-containing protein [Gammaproteobacteria bacterium]
MPKLFSKLLNKLINRVTNGDESNGNDPDLINIKIHDKIKELCLKTAAEGAVLLKNEDDILPLTKKDEIAVFGRCAYDYFFCGYGSGGGVVKEYTTNLYDGFDKYDIKVNENLKKYYIDFSTNNPKDDGFWGAWPLHYDEAPLTLELVQEAKKTSTKAVIVIGRSAGEDRECKLIKGSYYLTDEEENMIKLVTSEFENVILILDIGNIMDLSYLEKYNIKSVLLSLQGGQEGGNAIGANLSGAIAPSGHLTDTIAKNYEDYPSAKDFLGRKFNNYSEDIFVGYRYFETFAKDKVLFPFGYGLTYTKFEILCEETEVTNFNFKFKVSAKNIGNIASKASLQLYLKKPGVKFSEPERILVGYLKTKELGRNEEYKGEITVDLTMFASYDDKGVISDASYILEEGTYEFFLGENVRDAVSVYSIKYNFDSVVKKVSHIMPVEKAFERMINDNGKVSYEETPIHKIDLKNIILSNLPKEIPLTEYKGHKLIDVKNGTITLEEFVSELSLEELSALCHGWGRMNYDLGVLHNAGAMGGVTESLREKGIPAYVTTDGPSGVKVKYNSTNLPIGILIASTWDDKLVTELYNEILVELKERKCSCLLAPGMNIHRNPLCGRNFEYFSEDPFLSGMIAASVVNGVTKDGYSATPKHFCCNNQETNRFFNDSRVSERALREIYLKNFEIMLLNSHPRQIMTSYNMVNSIYSHNNYYLTQIYLREELAYDGCVMTDWYMRYRKSPEFKNVFGNAYRVRSRCDVLMPGSRSRVDRTKIGNTLLRGYGKKEGITLGEIELCAMDLLKIILESNLLD